MLYYAANSTTLYKGDCLEIHPSIPSQSVDLVLTDLPYGVTACEWDVKIPLDQLWAEWKRIIKPKGAIALFGTQPFTSELVMSNREWFKYEWIWDKVATSSGLHSDKQPLRSHENVCLFYKEQPTYNPEKTTGVQWYRGGGRRQAGFTGDAVKRDRRKSDADNLKFPKTIITFSAADKTFTQHPTQKPIALLQYLIRTYTNEGDTVLDSTCGSGSTLVAAQSINRKSIGIELDADYCAIAAQRLGSLEPQRIQAEGEKTGQLTIFDAVSSA